MVHKTKKSHLAEATSGRGKNLAVLGDCLIIGQAIQPTGTMKGKLETTEGFVVDPTDNKTNQSGGAGGMLPSGSSLCIAKAFSSERDIFERQG